MAVVKRPAPKPVWLKKQLPTGPEFEKVRKLLKNNAVHTVCQEAKCPNQWECFGRQTATFLILGDICTRNCRFCAVHSGPPLAVDVQEPGHVAQAAQELNLGYVVITSVTRDDLADGGAWQFAETIQALRRIASVRRIEVLIPDFQGNPEALHTVLDASPDVLNHNIETVPRLYAMVRPQADYRRSLEVLAETARRRPDIAVKSGLMLGLGERKDELRQTLLDLHQSGCRFLTLGQYLQPSADHLPVQKYLCPEEFEQWRQAAREIGFTKIASGPFVRSSYKAAEML